MQSGGEKRQKGEPLKAIVQQGEIGFYPFNSIAVTALAAEQTNTVITGRDDAQSSKYRNLTEFQSGSQSVSLKGKFFTGLTDAFYRGKLPELVIVSSDMMGLPAFLEEFLDYLEKLCGLGFITPNDAEEMAALDKYVPQILIATYGVVYEVILDKLKIALNNLNALSLRQRERLLQKFSRGLITSAPDGYDLQLYPAIFFPSPVEIHLAGTKSLYLVKTTQILEAHQIPYQFNPNGELGVLELELSLAHRHLLSRTIPKILKEGVPLAFSPEDLTREMDNLGQQFDILPGLVTQSPRQGKAKPEKEIAFRLSAADVAMVHQLKSLARNVNATALLGMLDELGKILHLQVTVTHADDMMEPTSR